MCDFQTVSRHCSEAVNHVRNSEASKHVKVLDNSYVESAIFGLLRIDLINYVKVKATLSKEFHIQPSETDKMVGWEYELFLKQLNELVKEENERNKQDESNTSMKDYQKMTNPNYIKGMQSQMMPKMDSFKMPKISGM